MPFVQSLLIATLKRNRLPGKIIVILKAGTNTFCSNENHTNFKSRMFSLENLEIFLRVRRHKITIINSAYQKIVTFHRQKNTGKSISTLVNSIDMCFRKLLVRVI